MFVLKENTTADEIIVEARKGNKNIQRISKDDLQNNKIGGWYNGKKVYSGGVFYGGRSKNCL